MEIRKIVWKKKKWREKRIKEDNEGEYCDHISLVF